MSRGVIFHGSALGFGVWKFFLTAVVVLASARAAAATFRPPAPY